MASTNQKLKTKFWTIFSEYIRRRDADFNGYVACCSCGKVKHWKQMDAGHYIAKNEGLAIYFEEKNVHSQCRWCNYNMHARAQQYALFLIRRYGPQILEELDWKSKQRIQIHDNEYLKFIELYKEKIKKLN
jgi:hypothetical protein